MFIGFSRQLADVLSLSAECRLALRRSIERATAKRQGAEGKQQKTIVIQ